MTRFRLERFTVDESNIENLAADPMMAPIVTAAAKALVDAAGANAPRGTGAYFASLHSTEAALVDDVWTAYAYSTDPFAHLVEFGSAKNPPYRPLTKGAHDVGFEFRDARA